MKKYIELIAQQWINPTHVKY